MQKIIESKYIEDLKLGSHQAFNALYNMYSLRLYSYCYQYTKSKEDAEEIVQDTFVKLWRYKETIRNEDTILYLLFRIAKNNILNSFRKTINSPIYEEYVNYKFENIGAANDTFQLIEYDDFVTIVKKIQQKLPQTQQKVFDCVIQEGMSNKETANELNLSEQTIKNQLTLALKTLRQKLKKYYQLIIIGFICFAS